MARLALRVATGALLAALATACLGGQTGQPTRGGCEEGQLSATAAWSDTTVQAAAQAFTEPYSGALQWWVEPRTDPSQTPVDLADDAQLTLVYAGASARRDCNGRIHVPVSVTLTTSDSGLTESGPATLEISSSAQGLEASFHYESKRIRLDATLPDPAGKAAPVVTFDALDSDLPGASASFTEGP